jgi:hypothetical protein
MFSGDIEEGSFPIKKWLRRGLPTERYLSPGLYLWTVLKTS